MIYHTLRMYTFHGTLTTRQTLLDSHAHPAVVLHEEATVAAGPRLVEVQHRHHQQQPHQQDNQGHQAHQVRGVVSGNESNVVFLLVLLK